MVDVEVDRVVVRGVNDVVVRRGRVVVVVDVVVARFFGRSKLD